MCEKLSNCWKIQNAYGCGLHVFQAAETAKAICQKCHDGKNKTSDLVAS